jgi:hypothetical protein
MLAPAQALTLRAFSPNNYFNSVPSKNFIPPKNSEEPMTGPWRTFALWKQIELLPCPST